MGIHLKENRGQKEKEVGGERKQVIYIYINILGGIQGYISYMGYSS